MVAPLEFASSAIINGPQVSVRDRKEREKKDSDSPIATYVLIFALNSRERGERQNEICQNMCDDTKWVAQEKEIVEKPDVQGEC